MNKNKILIIIVLILTVVITIGSMFIIKKVVDDKKVRNNNKQYGNNNYNIIDENEIHNKNNTYNEIPTVPFDKEKYDEKMKYLAENEANGIEERTIITIRDENNDEYNITDKDIEYYKRMGAKENETEEKIKKDMIEYKICYIESQKLGLTLRKSQLDNIEKMANLESDLKYIENNDVAKNKFIERHRNYLLQIDYWGELNSRIIEEISNNKISINDEKVDNKMKEYNKNIDDFLKIEEPTEQEQKEAAKKSISLLKEVTNLYIEAIERKYTVEYK